jgi:hypothetical protein
MSDSEEVKQKVIEWFQKNAKPGKTKYYMRDVVKGLPDLDKREVQKALNDCTVDGTLTYWSTGSSTMFCLPEHFHE